MSTSPNPKTKNRLHGRIGKNNQPRCPVAPARLNGAFSLIEVTIAVGIVSFCLIAVLGLLPTGLKAVKNANEQAAAANALNAIADTLRTATSTNSVTFSNSYAGQQINYAIGGSVTTNSWSNLTMEGVTNSTWKRLSARLDITPPSSLATYGRATVSVAWSAAANPVWSTNNKTWSNAEGSLTSGIIFLPRP